jgi:Rad3-related DNA helicase
MGILDFFSHSTSEPRLTQVDALTWLEKQTAKYLICEIPVGGGKSHVATTFAQYLNEGKTTPGGSFILTPQKILQQQYERSFVDNPQRIMATLYGKGNYHCINKNTTCDIGGLIKPPCGSCPYENAKALAKVTPHVVMNYKLALLILGFTTVFKNKRKLMVFDECHNIEQELTEFDAVIISKKRCEKYNLPYKEHDNVQQAFMWLKSAYLSKLDIILSDMLEEVDTFTNSKSHTADEIRKMRETNSLLEHSTTISHLVGEINEKEISDQLVLIKDPTYMKIKRLSAAHNFKNVFEQHADRFLFLSSTILDHKQFCTDLGIDPKEAAFLSLDSEFSKEHRPIFFMPVMKMNAAWKNPENSKGRTQMIETIVQLLNEHHHNESGIIHTANFAIAKWLTEQLKNKIPHNIFHHNPESGIDRGLIIESFQKSDKPGLLISPSITEGLDLVDDLSRFAIIVKVGFPFLGDAWIKRKAELSQQWYLRQTLIDVIQASGRVVRNKEDWGTVYILDSSFSYLKQQTKNITPKWWLDAYHQVY